jgi:hypothetical protein
MHYVAGRPLGLWLLIVVIVTEGLCMVGAALQLLVSAPSEWLAILTSALLGSLLEYKAYRLWCFHRAAWLVVLVASAVGGITHTLEIARGHPELSTWLAAAWAAVSVVYLIQPTVRGLFARQS